ncbi:hypothetical protein PR202_gb07443 [Eleusine coracana subsp. coracana]|uniref:Uncharacterized protein n=1 Tax=Eleusine coracana subsp. coracana TaxID=191504 RepID=A0AAV5E9Q2_ELECO|nr:hypothetical protein PR202_gb07443 [Eleusine coracana subsp. coracana]
MAAAAAKRNHQPPAAVLVPGEIEPGAGSEEVRRVRAPAAVGPRGGRRRAVDHRNLRVRRGPQELYGSAVVDLPGWTGLLCPCVLFGRNAEAVIGAPWMGFCTCHAICIEGGIALAIIAAACESVAPAPAVSCLLISEGLLCCWMVSAIFTTLARHELQKKYHLKNSPSYNGTLHATLAWSIAVFTVAQIVRSIVKGMGALLTKPFQRP